MTETTAPIGMVEYLLAFADDEHLMGQQHTEWIGVAPFLEEDLAFSSIGQDELGHAVQLYELVLELDGTEATDEAIDGLAYRRPAAHYRSSTLAEYVTTDWAEALVRHWLYDTVEELRWQLVVDSAHQPLADVAARARREESFHRRHADALLDPLLRSTDSRSRLLTALDSVGPHLPSLLDAPSGERGAVTIGAASAPLASVGPEVATAIETRFDRAVPEPWTTPATAGRTQRDPGFGALMARMLEVLDFDPDATW